MTEIDKDLYSRQIAAYGLSAMRSLSSSKVHVIGFNGTALAFCKNIILTGISEITISSSAVVKISDLSTNYYLKETDVGKSVLETIRSELSELNHYVKVNIDIKSNNDSINFNESDIYVLFNHDVNTASGINQICRRNRKRFIWVNSYGLMGNVFCDFDNFTTLNPNGKEPLTSLLEGIADDGLFGCIKAEPHGLSDGDRFKLSDFKIKSGFDNDEYIKQILQVEFEVDIVTNRHQFYVKNSQAFDWSFYKSGGRITEIKKKQDINFEDLSKQFNDPSIVNDFMDLNLVKLHQGFKTLQTFIVENNRLPNNWQNELPLTNYEDYKYHHILRNTCQGQFIPLCSILGAYSAQEVIKCVTQKYTPTQQWFYYHCHDILESFVQHNLTPKLDTLVQNDRYDDLRIIIGDELIKITKDQSYFIVGSGAIGCEHIANMVMLGIGCGDNSSITITDMDTIEKSNLSRQFLYRNDHIGRIKSEVSAMVASRMNPEAHIIAHQNKVCSETENIYNMDFFKPLDGVANALDNIQARRYMDEQCIFYEKPLFESGTLGTEGNTQVVIPRTTIHYGAEIDPPERDFAVCTIKNFPNSIQHTIHWAKNEFQNIFTDMPNSWNHHLNNPTAYLSYAPNQRGEHVKNIMFIWDNHPKNIADCIKISLNKFYTDYAININKILSGHPKDSLTTSGVPFWSGSKKCPSIIEFNASIKLHWNYVYHSSVLLAQMFNIKIDYDLINHQIYDVLQSYIRPKIDLNNTDESQIMTDDEEEKKRQEKELQSFIDIKLPDIEEMRKINVNSVEFEKDDDKNHHVDYMMCASNLRAINYEIEPVSKLETKLIAGKIIPAVATTTSIVSGLVMVEILKYTFNKKEMFEEEKYVELFKNSFFNLALATFNQFDPVECKSFMLNNIKYTLWDYIDINENMKISELLEHLTKICGVEIDYISYDKGLLISPLLFDPNKRTERLNMTILEALKYFNLPTDKESYDLQIDSFDNEDISLPSVRFLNK